MGLFKLKDKLPKIKEPGDYERGLVVEGMSPQIPCSSSLYPVFGIKNAPPRASADQIARADQKKAKAAAAAANRAPSPGAAINPLDELPKDTFKEGQPMIDNPDLFSCKWCKKSILKTTAVEHITGCLKIKKEKANRKKAAREARERAKEQALREERERRAEEEGITLGGDGDSGDDDDDEKGAGGKTTKKVAGKKAGDGDTKGKKRKAEGEPDKGPKQKKKKDEPKPKTKPKGEWSGQQPLFHYRRATQRGLVCLGLFNPPTSTCARCSDGLLHHNTHHHLSVYQRCDSPSDVTGRRDETPRATGLHFAPLSGARLPNAGCPPFLVSLFSSKPQKWTSAKGDMATGTKRNVHAISRGRFSHALLTVCQYDSPANPCNTQDLSMWKDNAASCCPMDNLAPGP